MQDVTGKRALVTGASRGIGKAIALALAAAGVDVAVNYRSASAAATEVVREIARGGRRAVAIAADVASTAGVEALVAETERTLGGIDILVNNAGIGTPLPLDAITERDWDEVIAVNLKSCFLATQRVLPGIRARRWGRIINLSSVAAQVGGVVGPHYAASKAGVLGLTRYYARHLAREGITANAIAPALIDTDMVTANPNASVNLIPVGRFGDVDEVAGVAVMLARNGYVTGQTINVNGGWFPS